MQRAMEQAATYDKQRGQMKHLITRDQPGIICGVDPGQTLDR